MDFLIFDAMLLVYTQQISPRFKFIFKQLCTRIIGIPVSFTTKVEDFVAHDSLKMSYNPQPLGNEFHVQSHKILFQQGITDLNIQVHDWDDTKCFFPSNDRSDLPFDIFAASFFMLSRYEEHLPHVKDEYGRYSAFESISLKNGFLHQPVVDIWAMKFKDVLSARFPDFTFPERRYSVVPLIDVPMAYYFLRKGILRTVGGTISDLVHLRFRQLYQRYLVLLKFQKDPYDTFSWIINKQKQYKKKFLVFFLIGNYSTYDKNTSINKKAFVNLIKSVADYCRVGLKFSFIALDKPQIMKREKERMESILNTDLEISRNSFSRVNLPATYREMVNLEVKEDYTMGYVDQPGFRAGTCTPFLFYDLDYEVQTPLLIHSYQIMDFALLRHKSLLDKQEELERIMDEVKKVNGLFIPVFHNYSFLDEGRWNGFKELFNLVLSSANETQ